MLLRPVLMPILRNPLQGIADGIRNMLAELLGSSQFFAPLTHSLVLSRGTGSPTFTRATTATFRDNEGVLRTVPSGCARFEGARYVRNLLTYTEDFSNAAWLITGVTRTATTITETATGTDHSIRYIVASGKNIWQIKVKPNGRTRCALASTGSTNKSAIFNLTTGVVEGALTDAFTTLGDNPTITLQSDGYYLITMGNLSGTSTLVDLYMLDATSTVRAYAGDITKGLFVKQAQLEDVTGRADQTTPSEYVSVGVVQRNVLFQTDDITNATWTKINGGTGTVPVVTSGQTDPNGGTTAFRVQTNCGAGGTGGDYSIVRQSVAASTLRKSVYVKSNTGSSQTFSFTTGTGSGNAVATTSWQRLEISNAVAVFDIAGTAGTAGTTQSLDLLVWHPQAEVAAAATEYQAVGGSYLYHGAGVDGVKYFDTDLDGNPIAASINTGYLAEGARTNLCLQSNAFTTTWADVNTPASTQNAIGPDGATSAWTLTDNAAGAKEGINQSITLTAAAYTFSVFVKKTTGAQTGYPVLYFFTGTTIAICTVDTTSGVATPWTSFSGGLAGFTSLAGVSARCTSYNTNFWRVELTGTGTVASYSFALFPAASTNPTQASGDFDNAATGSAVFYGAQVELGSFASSYIATTTLAVARNADVLTYSSAGNILGTVGWAYAEWTYPRAATITTSPRIINTGSGSVPLYLSSALSGDLGLYDGTIRDGPTPAYPVTTPTKSASTWGGSAAGIANAGVSVTTAFDGDMNVGSTIDIGCINGTGGFELNGTIRNVRIGQRQLSASEMQAITA